MPKEFLNMNSDGIELYAGVPKRSRTLREIAGVFFRHWRRIVVTFSVIVFSVTVYVWIMPRMYEAETEILVKRERADPVVTPENNAAPTLAQAVGVSEEDLNSEVELLQGRDLLEKVVIACGLDREPAGFIIRLVNRLSGTQDYETLRVPLAVRKLQKKLKVSALGRTNLVKVTYESRDPRLAANVLKTLTDFYLAKHLEVHRPPGTFAFFQNETTHYWDGLQAAERKLANFNLAQNTVSAQTEKSAAEQKLADFEATLHQIRTSTAATQGRIQTLTAQMVSTPDRLTTQIRTNSLLLEQLKSTLLTLELKRTEMTGKYAPSYVTLRDLDAQIAQTRAAIAKEDDLPLHDDTTDRNPTYQWMSDELAKATTDLASLQSQGVATERQISAYRSELLILDAKDLEQQDLVRATKVQEANYLLYQNKREEAQISDALDQKHIVNVVVAEAATTPALPSDLGPFIMLAIGFVVAGVASYAVASGAEHFSAYLRNPDDVRRLLELPVLAAFPKAIGSNEHF
jgi:uncharacterized protein involved in exopolysaccharide biosynthesis